MRCEIRFWKSAPTADGSPRECDTAKDYNDVLRGFPEQRDLIIARMKAVATDAVRGPQRGSRQGYWIRPLLDLVWVIAKRVDPVLDEFDEIKEKAADLVESGGQQEEGKPGSPAMPGDARFTSARRAPRKRGILERITDLVRGRGKTTYEGQITIPSHGHDYYIDFGLDVETHDNQAVVTFWKFQQGVGG